MTAEGAFLFFVFYLIGLPVGWLLGKLIVSRWFS